MKKKQWRKLWMRGRSDGGEFWIFDQEVSKFWKFLLNASHQTIMMEVIEEKSSLR
jgi:hypothetical protein